MGGSVLLSDEVDVHFFKKLVEVLSKSSERYKIFIVVGGGSVARKYIQLGRSLKIDEKKLDSFGIAVTRLNATVLINILENSNIEIPCTTNQACSIECPIVVMGGTTPGHSTDMVGAELAEKVNAELFIIATNVEGIYDKDPNKYSNAKHIKEITIDQLINRYGTEWKSAGKNIVIDGPALKILKRAKVSTYVVNGKRLDQLENVINKQSFHGTKIIF
jgi:uridylate kinase